VFIIIANIVHEIKGAANIFDTSDPCVKHIIANASVNIKTQHEKVLDFLHEYTKIQRARDKIVKTYTDKHNVLLVQLRIDIAHETPNKRNKIGHIIPKAVSGGLNLTLIPDSLLVLHKIFVPKPIIEGNNM